MAILAANGVALPAPTIIKIDNEIAWSSSTGHTSNGAVAGDVVAGKKTVTIEWGVLQESEMAKIRRSLTTGFFPFAFNGDGGANLPITSYRGTINKGHIGFLGDDVYWYKEVTVKIIQR